MKPNFVRHYDFRNPLDEMWEMIPEKGWSFDMAPGQAHFVNTTDAKAEIYLRPSSMYGDRIEFQLAPGRRKAGMFAFGFLAGFEYVTMVLNLDTGDLQVKTHESHKAQPRLAAKAPTAFTRLAVIREQDRLPGLPYEGSKVSLLCDDQTIAAVRHIDFLPQSFFMFGLWGPGEINLASFAIRGPSRPQPEYVRVGIWQQSIKPRTAANVEALILGVRQAAEAGVEILITPETSLTGCRPDSDPEMRDRSGIQAELKRFQKAVASIPNAPHTLVGYPEWIKGSEVEGATLAQVKVNSHRFVRPDGALGPMMAKVHSCEEGFWHGRNYNLQRVAGVLTATGVCHDGHYQDVWSVGVMGGARLCLHPSAGGNLSGSIPAILAGYKDLGTAVDAYWVRVNAGGGAAIVYPTKNRKYPETILAVPKDLTEASPTYPEYSPMGDLLAHARIRLWDAGGTYPLRTLRSGKQRFKIWSSLIPTIRSV